MFYRICTFIWRAEHTNNFRSKIRWWMKKMKFIENVEKFNAKRFISRCWCQTKPYYWKFTFAFDSFCCHCWTPFLLLISKKAAHVIEFFFFWVKMLLLMLLLIDSIFQEHRIIKTFHVMRLMQTALFFWPFDDLMRGFIRFVSWSLDYKSTAMSRYFGWIKNSNVHALKLNGFV